MKIEEIEEKARQEAKNYKTIYSEDFTMSDMLSRPQDVSKQSIKDVYFCLKEKHYRDGFTNGAKWGIEHEWHDLRKNPNDLPPKKTWCSLTVVNQIGTPCHYNYDKSCWQNWSFIDIETPIAWCELPHFKE